MIFPIFMPITNNKNLSNLFLRTYLNLELLLYVVLLRYYPMFLLFTRDFHIIIMLIDFVNNF